LRGIRIQNIVSQLNGERIDVIQWDADPATFIANALSPASVLNVELNEEEKVTTVTVPERQLSLAIGKEGQNARLAAKLTGWRIDLRSSSPQEVQEAAPKEEAVKAEAEKPSLEIPPPAAAVVHEVEPQEVPSIPAEELQEEAAQPIEEVESIPISNIVLPSLSPVEEPSEGSGIRFAEDILMPTSTKHEAKKRKKGRKKAFR
jgi:N utilization substance protein A